LLTSGVARQPDGLLTVTELPSLDVLPLAQLANGFDETVMLVAPAGHANVPENW
jgi:hypothetical protein